jgi:pimeloyl-ACP methyl ester carboxylesterase
MTIKPHVGHAKTGGQVTRLHRPHKILPIILVPGVMGTRLTDPLDGKLVWNPLGEPLGGSAGAFTVNYDRLQQISAPLVPDETNQYEDEDKNLKWEPVKHFFNVLTEKYEPLLQAIVDCKDPALEKYGVRLKAYCCGYDWRQDNAKSALRLAAVVDEALRETGARRVILIGHSMGCTVARYYCRVLGGESRVHRLILLGSPTLGAPSAYNYLKIGPPGQYVKDVKTALQEGNEKAAVFELMRSGGTIAQTIAGLAGGGGDWKDFFGSIYLALCLGAGRMLTRRETTYFARQIPSLYQLLPNSIYSRENKSWLFFDPFATGYKPTGFMVILPTLFEVLTMQHLAEAADVLAGASNETANKIHDDMNAWLDPERAERTSSRAKRNAMTIVELYAAITKSMSGDFLVGWEWAELVDFISDFWKRVMEMMFVDCRNPQMVYEDIYTGFLDHVDMRAVSAGNVALATRMDQALTVNYAPEKPSTPGELLKNALGNLFSTPGGQVFLDTLKNIGVGAFHAVTFGIVYAAGGLTYPELEKGYAEKHRWEDMKKEKERLLKLKNPPRAYMPPQTVNVYSTGLPIEGGGILFPISVISNDDSNVVSYELIPRLAAVIFGVLPEKGDGTLPDLSVNPPEAFISNKFFQPIAVPGVLHAEMCQDKRSIEPVMKAIVDSLESFAADRLGVDVVTQ